jgi:hypothetical protein
MNFLICSIKGWLEAVALRVAAVVRVNVIGPLLQVVIQIVVVELNVSPETGPVNSMLPLLSATRRLKVLPLRDPLICNEALFVLTPVVPETLPLLSLRFNQR